jgi:hypothetical protein
MGQTHSLFSKKTKYLIIIIQNIDLYIDLCFGYFVYIYMCIFTTKNKYKPKIQIGEIKWQKESYHLAYSQEKMTYHS